MYDLLQSRLNDFVNGISNNNNLIFYYVQQTVSLIVSTLTFNVVFNGLTNSDYSSNVFAFIEELTQLYITELMIAFLKGFLQEKTKRMVQRRK